MMVMILGSDETLHGEVSSSSLCSARADSTLEPCERDRHSSSTLLWFSFAVED